MRTGSCCKLIMDLSGMAWACRHTFMSTGTARLLSAALSSIRCSHLHPLRQTVHPLLDSWVLPVRPARAAALLRGCKISWHRQQMSEALGPRRLASSEH
jgi:hypothetical protein